MIEQPSLYYLLWPILIFIKDQYPILGTQALQADILFAAPYLLFIASAYTFLYASAARKQASLTGMSLFITGMVSLLLDATNRRLIYGKACTVCSWW